MLKRQLIYLNEMFPPAERTLVSILLFFEIYFVLLLNMGVVKTRGIGIQEFIGAFTVFSFLLLLRIADDFKDYDTDRRLFPERALPSGRVRKNDLWVLLLFFTGITVILNILFMNNLPWFFFLYIYGFLMSMWFFSKSKIQKNLFLALITHNPIVMILNIYVLSFTTIKYSLPVTIYTVLLAFTMYFPGLIWEIARKIRSPEDETEYVTYSSLIGYRKASFYVLILILVDIVTNIFLVINLIRPSVVLLILNTGWITWYILSYIRNPHGKKLVKMVEIYTFITEGIMVLTVALFLRMGYI